MHELPVRTLHRDCAEKLGCYAASRGTLRVQGMGGTYTNRGILYGVTRWQFEGREIFKRAVQGVAAAADNTLTRVGLTAEDVDLVVPHQVLAKTTPSAAPSHS